MVIAEGMEVDAAALQDRLELAIAEGSGLPAGGEGPERDVAEHHAMPEPRPLLLEQRAHGPLCPASTDPYSSLSHPFR
jgi:hypothetical protein